MLLKPAKKDNNQILDTNKYCLSNVKLFAITLIGIFGLYIFGLFAQFIALAFPDLSIEQTNGVINFLTYAMLFITILGVLNKDIILIAKSFKDWRNILIGLALGFAMVLFQIGYSSFVNLFYEMEASGNETGLRSFITLYPICSVIFLCFVGPLCEEATYRVSLFGLCKFNKIVAYIVAVLVFAFAHFRPDAGIINELINLPMYLMSAAVLTFTYDKFGFASSFSCHLVNNLWSVLGIIILSNIG